MKILPDNDLNQIIGGNCIKKAKKPHHSKKPATRGTRGVRAKAAA